jgi:hypothetical protein
LGLEDQLALLAQQQSNKNSKEKKHKAAEGPNTANPVVLNEAPTLKGIYKLDGKTLTYCVAAPGLPRPRDFSLEKGSGQTLVTLERFSTGEGPIEAALVRLGATFRTDEVGYITSVTIHDPLLVDDDLKLLPNLKKLTNVSLGKTNITDAGLFYLKHVKNLHDLQLNGTRITDDGLKQLQDLELWTLHLSDTQITDAGLQHLRGFKKLYNLHLSGTRITDEGLRTLRELPGLESVFLERTGVTDAGVAHLVRIPKLTFVRLAGTRITDAGVKQLARLPKLSNVSLGGTVATDASLEYLQNVKTLTYLSLLRPEPPRRPVIDTAIPRVLADVKPPLRLPEDVAIAVRDGDPARTANTQAEPQFSARAIRELQKALPKLKIRSGR